jgi:L1 cell adhesion molecule like protein
MSIPDSIVSAADNTETLSTNHAEFPTFKIVGDNVDKTIKPRQETSQHHNQSLHYFHSYAVKDRIDVSSLEDNPGLPDFESIDTFSVLPTEEDKKILKDNMAIIAGKQ